MDQGFRSPNKAKEWVPGPQPPTRFVARPPPAAVSSGAHTDSSYSPLAQVHWLFLKAQSSKARVHLSAQAAERGCGHPGRGCRTTTGTWGAALGLALTDPGPAHPRRPCPAQRPRSMPRARGWALAVAVGEGPLSGSHAAPRRLL